MADLFVSYRYWREYKKRYEYSVVVITSDELDSIGISAISSLNEIRRIADYIDHIDTTILYWRRMEELKGD